MALKDEVRAHWEAETCGTRYGDAAQRRAFFQQVSETRYALEPFIEAFADFPSAKGKHVLEIGVGAGSDFSRWADFADHVTGVDLTKAAVSLTDERMRLEGKTNYDVQVADAENLPFQDATFDKVYAYGVLHHSPDTARAFQEAVRVLKPGGTLKAMVYQPRSWTAWMLALRYLKLPRKAVYDHLESPGTKTYTASEIRRMLPGLALTTRAVFSPGDTLDIRPSAKYAGRLYSLIWKVYPRRLVRALGPRFGLFLLIEARKPV